MSLTHLDEEGRPQMVDVTHKEATLRTAIAEAYVELPEEALRALEAGGVGKGDPLRVAELAGIMGAKRTPDLIPLCHPLPLSGVEVRAELLEGRVRIQATVRTKAETGVEMEALTACAIAALTLYDMLKAASKGLVISRIQLLEKTGGQSGPWRREG